ncbi:hypothetical protein ABWH74_005293 [Burkholderia vietnamiensis]
MQFKIIRHRDKEGAYREGHRVQCLRRVREVTPDFPEGKNVQRVVAKFDREARELPADVLAILTSAEVDEWREWRVKQDEEELKAAAQFELDTLAESARVARIGLAKSYATTTPENAVAIRKEFRALVRTLIELGLMPEPVRGRPEKEEGSDLPLLPNFAPPGTPAYESYQRLLDEHERLKAQNNGG